MFLVFRGDFRGAFASLPLFRAYRLPLASLPLHRPYHTFPKPLHTSFSLYSVLSNFAGNIFQRKSHGKLVYILSFYVTSLGIQNIDLSLPNISYAIYDMCAIYARRVERERGKRTCHIGRGVLSKLFHFVFLNWLGIL